VTSTHKELACLADALRLLKKARSLQELVECLDAAKAIARFRQQGDSGQQAIDEASFTKLYAERKLGELLQKTELAKGSPGNQYSGKLDRSHDATGPIHLKDIGVSKSRSSRAQQLAAMPHEEFNGYVAEAMKAGQQPTVAGALKLSRRNRASNRPESSMNVPSGFVTSLQTLLANGRVFSTIMADPPWRHDNQASRASASNHYPTMSLDEICSEPVAELAAKNSHLHLWATSPLLPEALVAMEAWGFRYKASFVWVKPQIGMGNYWRISHELLLLGVRGKLGFRNHSQRSWLEAGRTRHSEKPAEIRKLVEKVSPGPYLEMYGRRPPANPAWTVFGNELTSEEEQ